jgi:hypothetical protein
MAKILRHAGGGGKENILEDRCQRFGESID